MMDMSRTPDTPAPYGGTEAERSHAGADPEPAAGGAANEGSSPEPFGRRDKRVVTMLLLARLDTDAGDTLVRVRNVSSGGAMVETSMPMSPGMMVRLEMRELVLEGRVAWTESPRAGIQFSQPVELETLLNAPAGKGNDPFGAEVPKLKAECVIRLRGNGFSCTGTLLEIMPKGAWLKSARTLELDEQVTLDIPEMAPQQAAVRRILGEEVGVTLLAPIPFAALDSWSHNRSVRFDGRGLRSPT